MSTTQTVEELNEILIKATYGDQRPVAPDGWEFTGRWLRRGDDPNAMILTLGRRVHDAFVNDCPCLELRRVPEPPKPRTQKLLVYVFSTPLGFMVSTLSRYTINGEECECVGNFIGEFTLKADTEPAAEAQPSPGVVRWCFEAPEGQTPVVLVPTGEVRAPKTGDPFLYTGVVLTAMHGMNTAEHPILRRVEPSRVTG